LAFSLCPTVSNGSGSRTFVPSVCESTPRRLTRTGTATEREPRDLILTEPPSSDVDGKGDFATTPGTNDVTLGVRFSVAGAPGP
jgi:hypothetical protein